MLSKYEILLKNMRQQLTQKTAVGRELLMELHLFL